MNIFFNDAYQISMLYAHWKTGRQAIVGTAEAFFRKYPHSDDEGMVVMAGAYLINEIVNADWFKTPFTHEDMGYVQHDVLKLSDGDFEPFAEYLLEIFPQELARLEVSYVRDGEILRPEFPVIQVTGPVGAIHMVETSFVGILNTGVRAATVARRLRRKVGSRIKLMDFATRRQQCNAAIETAVGSIIGGFDSTSNMEAGRLHHVPVSGTMAHAYVLSYGMHGELQAFKDFLRAFPINHCLLVDTFDIKQGVANAMRAAFETGISLRAIRLDSGDWVTVIPMAREMLNMMGCTETKIIVSGDYDEVLIEKLSKFRSPTFGVGATVLDLIDGIGIGSYLSAPGFSLGFVYKLVEIGSLPVMKKSAGGKTSLPHKKFWLAKEGDHTRTNYLELALAEGFETILEPDQGGVRPVSLEYIHEARRLTQRRISVDTSWVTSSVCMKSLSGV